MQTAEEETHEAQTIVKKNKTKCDLNGMTWILSNDSESLMQHNKHFRLQIVQFSNTNNSQWNKDEGNTSMVCRNCVNKNQWKEKEANRRHWIRQLDESAFTITKKHLSTSVSFSLVRKLNNFDQYRYHDDLTIFIVSKHDQQIFFRFSSRLARDIWTKMQSKAKCFFSLGLLLRTRLRRSRRWQCDKCCGESK